MAKQSKALTSEEIFGMEDLGHERVTIPEWGGGHVFVRSLSGLEKVQFEKSLPDDEVETTGEDGLRLYAGLVALATVDDEGRQIFNTNGDVEKLAEKNFVAVMRIASAAAKLNGMERKSIEEMVKNLSETAANASE